MLHVIERLARRTVAAPLRIARAVLAGSEVGFALAAVPANAFELHVVARSAMPNGFVTDPHVFVVIPDDRQFAIAADADNARPEQILRALRCHGRSLTGVPAEFGRTDPRSRMAGRDHF